MTKTQQEVVNLALEVYGRLDEDDVTTDHPPGSHTRKLWVLGEKLFLDLEEECCNND